MAEIIINFCPTGMVPTTRHSRFVPVTVSRIVEEVHQASELGITIAHLHARDPDEAPTSRPEVYAEIVAGIRRHAPDLLICLSTSGRNTPAFEHRSAVIELRPDLCSLTLGSINFTDQASVNSPEMIVALAEKMKAYGVKPELECFHTGMINYAKYLIGKGVLQGPFLWNLLFGSIGGMQSELVQLGSAIDEIRRTDTTDSHHIALAGLGNDQLKSNAIAIACGYGVRVGLEDNLWFDRDRAVPASNGALLGRVHDLIRLHQHQVMAPASLGYKGFYNASVHPR